MQQKGDFMNIQSKKETLRLSILNLLLVFVGTVSVFADITYTLHLDGVDQGIRSQLEYSVAEAVGLLQSIRFFQQTPQYYYSAGVPTAQANFDGVITLWRIEKLPGCDA